MNQNFITDEFLPDGADCPVFGFNLACAYPFPESGENAYNRMAKRLAELDEAVYVYPLWETHVTIMTFLNFSRHRQPTPEKLANLRSLMAPVAEIVGRIFDNIPIKPFQMELGPPLLTPKAVILPITNPSGEITQIRQSAIELLKGNMELYEELLRHGLNVPGIIHSTVMRFKKQPRDISGFSTDFDALAATISAFTIPVSEILLTTETKPYMRAGEIMKRFSLATSQL